MSNKLELSVIGSGSAFDTELTNSSFYVTVNETNILIDCGYNVFSKLKEDFEDILNDLHIVFITHMDDDHVGSLRSLLYYRYFILGKTTVVSCGDGVKKDLLNWLPKNEEIRDNKLIHAPIYEMHTISEYDTEIDIGEYFFIYSIKGEHHIENYGCAIGIRNHAMVAVSGDTIATANFESTITNIKEYFNIKEEYILHDFSYYNDPSVNTHACESNINAVYSKEFIKKLHYYHNNKNGLIGKVYELI